MSESAILAGCSGLVKSTTCSQRSLTAEGVNEASGLKTTPFVRSQRISAT